MKNLEKLADALVQGRTAIMARWREQVRDLDSAKHLDLPTLNDHMPVWLAELAAALRTLAAHPTDEGEDPAIPLAHGLQRFEDGFDIDEVVAEYNILRDCVHEVAERDEIELRGRARRVVNRVFDDAIAAAVKAFAGSQAREVQRRRAEHLAFVAHDLRTPLAAITFATKILDQKMPALGGDAEIARLLKILGRNTKQLDALVSRVLDENTQLLTEIAVQVERRTFDLWPLVETLLQDLQPVALKGATRLVNQVPDDLDVRADAGLMQRIFQNLISNAIRYTPGGEVVVGARQGGDGVVHCWVTDNGIGIPAHRIHTVFNALETDPEHDGSGLGLAIVKTFVEAHGGTVTVESIEGRGCTFLFTLPLTVPVASPEKVPVPG
ncbi:MAG TPA: HAMP domain-containing sensor histidine kinase [Usitatibacter sp.]|nr:HAMP domain-containing sensor histidine kinase [Usitatibacter sp.]